MNINDKFKDGTSLSSDAFYRLRKNKMAMLGLVFLLLLIAVALLTPMIAPYTYDAQDLELGAKPPSAEHWLGTDTLGRDLLTRIMYGSRISLMVAFVATTVALCIGVLWGATAGFFGGRIDSIMMRIVDVLFALPFTMIIILLTVVLGSSMLLLYLAIGAVEWLTMARIVRGEVMNIKQQEFVEAAITMGMSPWQIITRHLIPNVIGTVIVYATLTVPSVILLESFLSFLGLGIQPPQSSWGSLISSGVEVMEEFPWLILFPSLVLALTLFSLNFLGDGLRDALDPRASKD